LADEASKLLPLLTNGAKGYTKAIDEAIKSGNILTRQQAESAAAFAKSIATLGNKLTGFAKQLTVKLSEPLAIVVNYINKMIDDMGGMQGVATSFAKSFIGGIKSSIQAVQMLIKSFVKLENLMLKGEKLLLAPKILGEAAAQMVTGSTVTGASTERAFEIDKQIKENNASLPGNNVINSLDKLIADIDNNIAMSAGVEIKSSADKASKNFISLSNNTTKTADSMKALTAATSTVAKNMTDKNGGYQTSLGYVSDKPLEGRVGSIQEYINAMPAGKALQEMRQRGVFSGDSAANAVNGTPKTAITLNMVTDAGKVTGELMGSQEFIDGISRLQNEKMSKTARMAAV